MNPLFTLITSVIGKVFPDKSQQDLKKLEIELQTAIAESNIDLEQIKVNAAQAQNSNLFVSGPRPFIMWGIGIILVFYGFLTTGINFAVALGYHVVPMPPMDPMLRDIILGLLGLGYITRTYEKSKGVSGNH